MRSAIDRHGSARDLQRSPYASSFAHMGEVYVYHDLFGYILQMSPDLLEFLDAFGTGKRVEEVCKKYANAFDEMTPESFVGTFIQFGCLITPGYDQLADIWDMIPVKSRWNVWTRGDDGNVTLTTAWGDRPTQMHALSAEETKIWDAINGELSLEALAEWFDKDAVGALIKRLVHHDVQALKLSALAMSYYKNRAHMRPPYVTSTMPYAPYVAGTPLPPGPDAQFSTDGYYEHEVEDANAQFDHEETTLSHLFRRPHPALHGKTYGAALVEGLGKRWDLGTGPFKVLEIGGGLGWVAKAVTEALQALGGPVTYHILELSPALAKAQRENTQGLPITVFEGDALKADFPGDDYDLVISNEMVGDLTAVKLTHEQLGMGGEGGIDDEKFEAGLDALGEAGALVKRHKVPIGDAPDPFYLNVGAWRLVERIWDALRPGGHAVITEFGELGRYPILSSQLDHPELSTHFGHLTIVSTSLGFRPKFEYIIDLVNFDRDKRGLATTRSYFRALAAALAPWGIELEKIGYTEEMFSELLGGKLVPNETLGSIEFDRIEDRLMGLVPHEFKALLLTKPEPVLEA